MPSPTQPSRCPYGWAIRSIGIALIVLGASFLVHAFARFVRQGLGTPAPVAPTQHLVVTGIYRYVRNPMYLAVWTTILGQAILFANWAIVVYLVIAAATMITFVTAYEQPTLRRTFGQEYADYCRAVPAWIPRLTPAS